MNKSGYEKNGHKAVDKGVYSFHLLYKPIKREITSITGKP